MKISFLLHNKKKEKIHRQSSRVYHYQRSPRTDPSLSLPIIESFGWWLECCAIRVFDYYNIPISVLSLKSKLKVYCRKLICLFWLIYLTLHRMKVMRVNARRLFVQSRLFVLSFLKQWRIYACCGWMIERCLGLFVVSSTYSLRLKHLWTVSSLWLGFEFLYCVNW